MFSKQEQRQWIDWLLHETCHSQNPVIRLSIVQQMDGSHHVRAMLARASYYDTERNYVVGIVKYDSEQLFPRLNMPSTPSPLVIPVATGSRNVSGDPDWYSFLEKEAEYCREWMTQAPSLCLHRRFDSTAWHPISMSSLLSLRYLTVVQGMVRQELGSTRDKSLVFLLGDIALNLTELIEDGYDDLAKVVVGLVH